MNASPRFLLLVLILALSSPPILAGDEKPPKGRALKKLVEQYVQADPKTRSKMIDDIDETYAPLDSGDLKKLREEILKIVKKKGPKIKLKGTNYFYSKKEKRGKYIAKGKPGKTLFIGLHGGGKGSGDAGSMAGPMGGGGWFWIFPEVLEKTEHGWTDSGTEEFVLELIEAAKRTIPIDPNRIYITGHSMGGYGSWTLGAHHADVFAGAAAYAGAPTPYWAAPGSEEVGGIEDGVIPNLFNIRFFFFQSLDDPRVKPNVNIFANQELLRWKEKHPGGFDFRYDEVDGRGHAAPKKGYVPTQKWVAEKVRDPRPKKILWQSTLPWKNQFYWLYWKRPLSGTLIEATIEEGNVIQLKNTGRRAYDFKGMTVLIPEPHIDLDQEIVIRAGDREAFRGKVQPTLSTLLLTGVRHDPDLLFNARVEL